MGPTIILDKSTLQGLTGNDEVVLLRQYFIVNIVPVLLREIGADLRKKKVRTSPEKEIRDLSRKLSQLDSIVCPELIQMVQIELLGDEVVPLNGQVPLFGEFSTDEAGNTILVARQLKVEDDVLRWQLQRYKDEDYADADAWRLSTDEKSLERLRNENKDLILQLKEYDDLPKLLAYVDRMLAAPEAASLLMEVFQTLSQLNALEFAKVVERWERAGKPPLAQFVPYSFYCIRVTLFHHMGLLRGFFTTRAKDLYDLQYVYYLPFCHVFSSSDNFLRAIVPTLMRKDQVFVVGSDLKADLNRAVTCLRSEGKAEVQTSHPPSDSLVHRIWEQLKWGASEAQTEPLLSAKNQDIPVARKRRVHLDSPCFCGSGKTLRVCCYAKWQFSRNRGE